MRLSIIIPVYNERATIAEVLTRVQAVELDTDVVIVDDASTDGTSEWLKEWVTRQSGDVILRRHNRNQGKGAAIRTGLATVTGDYVVIQDGDLEYDPNDYVRLLAPLLAGQGKVVYGSRLLGGQQGMVFTQWAGNATLTKLTNLLFRASLTDMETCYKMFARDVIDGLHLTSNRFNIEPELTAKVLKQGLGIIEVPISYTGRSYSKGKKINWRDFISAVWTLLRLRL